jgi:hypothetical protein
MPSPYIPKTYLHFGSLRLPSSIVLAGPYLLAHSRPLSLPACTPCPLLPIVLTAANALPSQSLTHSHCLVPPRPVFPQRPDLSSCAHPLLSSPHILPVLSPCVRVRQTKAKLAKLDKVKRTIVSRPVHVVLFIWFRVDEDRRR